MKKNKDAQIKYVGWLLESAISSVLIEQADQMQQQQSQVAPVAPAAPDVNAAPPTDPTQAPVEGEVQPTMSLDDLIEKLNLIRGGRSFTDPEVYTRMGEVFKSFTDQQKVDLESGLSKIIDVIVNPDEQAQQQPGNAPAAPQSQTPQPQATPPSPTPQAAGVPQTPIS